MQDNCQLCRGKRGGIAGNENVVKLAGLDVIVCDYCHTQLTYDKIIPSIVLPQFVKVWATPAVHGFDQSHLYALAVGGTVWEWIESDDPNKRGWLHLDGVAPEGS